MKPRHFWWLVKAERDMSNPTPNGPSREDVRRWEAEKDMTDEEWWAIHGAS